MRLNLKKNMKTLILLACITINISTTGTHHHDNESCDKVLKGEQGPVGPKGNVGPRGVDGADGPQGLAGLRGIEGDKGEQGPEGKQGKKGKDGKDLIGETGDKGDQGRNGTACLCESQLYKLMCCLEKSMFCDLEIDSLKKCEEGCGVVATEDPCRKPLEDCQEACGILTCTECTAAAVPANALGIRNLERIRENCRENCVAEASTCFGKHQCEKGNRDCACKDKCKDQMGTSGEVECMEDCNKETTTCDSLFAPVEPLFAEDKKWCITSTITSSTTDSVPLVPLVYEASKGVTFQIDDDANDDFNIAVGTATPLKFVRCGCDDRNPNLFKIVTCDEDLNFLHIGAYDNLDGNALVDSDSAVVFEGSPVGVSKCWDIKKVGDNYTVTDFDNSALSWGLTRFDGTVDTTNDVVIIETRTGPANEFQIVECP